MISKPRRLWMGLYFFFLQQYFLDSTFSTLLLISVGPLYLFFLIHVHQITLYFCAFTELLLLCTILCSIFILKGCAQLKHGVFPACSSANAPCCWPCPWVPLMPGAGVEWSSWGNLWEVVGCCSKWSRGSFRKHILGQNPDAAWSWVSSFFMVLTCWMNVCDTGLCPTIFKLWVSGWSGIYTWKLIWR